MDKNDFSGLGDQIKDIVEDVMDTKNYAQLNKNISDTVNSALDEVQSMLKGKETPAQKPQNKGNWFNKQNQTEQSDSIYRYKYRPYGHYRNGQYKNPQNPIKEDNNHDFRKWENKRQDFNYARTRRNETVTPANTSGAVISKNPRGSVAGILFTVFGSIGAGVTGFLLFGFLLTLVYGLGFGEFIIGTTLAILIPLFLISLFMMRRGHVIRKRVKRFRSYIIQMNGKEYGSIKQFASSIGQSEKYVIKDLKKMIHLGMFPQGHLDDQKTCFMLTANMYEQYLKSQEELKKRELIEEEEKNQDDTTKEFKKVMEDGKSYINQIKTVNDAIPDIELSNKLYRLEVIISKIFDHVEQHPSQMPEIRKFMEYYLPTTLKLVNAYQEFDTQPIQGENILNAKDEIRKTLDTINQAFENLLDSLFEDAAMDVSTDISVLETMLAQEGLTEKDFNTK